MVSTVKCLICIAATCCMVSAAGLTGVDTLHYTANYGEGIYFRPIGGDPKVGLAKEFLSDSGPYGGSCFICEDSMDIAFFVIAGSCPACPCCCELSVGSGTPFYRIPKSAAEIDWSEELDLSSMQRVTYGKNSLISCVLPQCPAKGGNLFLVRNVLSRKPPLAVVWVLAIVEEVYIDPEATRYSVSGGLGYPPAMCRNTARIRWYVSKGNTPDFSDHDIVGVSPRRPVAMNVLPAGKKSIANPAVYDITGRRIHRSARTVAGNGRDFCPIQNTAVGIYITDGAYLFQD